MALWADQNPTQFYQLLSKLFPQHVEGKLGVDQSLAAILMKMGSPRPGMTIDQPEDATVLSETKREALTLQVHAPEHAEEKQ